MAVIVAGVAPEIAVAPALSALKVMSRVPSLRVAVAEVATTAFWMTLNVQTLLSVGSNTTAASVVAVKT